MSDELLHFDIYGCKVEGIDLVKDQMEELFGIKMRQGDSTFCGRYFWFSNGEYEEVECKRNWNVEDEEILFEGYREYPIIVQIGGTLHPEEFEQKLKTSKIQFDLLERELA